MSNYVDERMNYILDKTFKLKVENVNKGKALEQLKELEAFEEEVNGWKLKDNTDIGSFKVTMSTILRYQNMMHCEIRSSALRNIIIATLIVFVMIVVILTTMPFI